MKWKLKPVQTWSAAESYAEVEWSDLGTCALEKTVQFIRVTGTATAEQAPDVIKAISNLRKVSDAFVLTNAVKIDGVSDMAELQVSMEEVKSFDVLAYLLDQLEEKQVAVVKELLEGEQIREAA